MTATDVDLEVARILPIVMKKLLREEDAPLRDVYLSASMRVRVQDAVRNALYEAFKEVDR